MKTIRFTQTVIRRRHGTEQVFEEGVKYPLPDDVANHYIKRGQAQEVVGKGAAKTTSSEVEKQEAANASVDSSASVDGADSGGSGGRTKPAGKPAGGRKSGATGKGKGARGK